MTSENKNTVKFEWTIHPLKANWKVSLALIVFLLALCISIYFSFKSIAFFVLSMAFLFGSLSSFFLPTKYMLQDDCILVKSLLRTQSREWDSFKRLYPDKNGVFLSPFAHQTRLENFRGLYVRLGENREELLDFIRQKINQSCGDSE